MFRVAMRAGKSENAPFLLEADKSRAAGTSLEMIVDNDDRKVHVPWRRRGLRLLTQVRWWLADGLRPENPPLFPLQGGELG